MTIADKGSHEMVAMIRKARRVWRDTENRDKTVDAIHLMRPEVGIEGAENFFDWMAGWDGVPATNLAHIWCQLHWCPLTLEHAETHESKADDAWQRLMKFVRDSPKEWQRMLEDGTVLSWGTPLKNE